MSPTSKATSAGWKHYAVPASSSGSMPIIGVFPMILKPVPPNTMCTAVSTKPCQMPIPIQAVPNRKTVVIKNVLLIQ
jgi:hypothetical protein